MGRGVSKILNICRTKNIYNTLDWYSLHFQHKWRFSIYHFSPSAQQQQTLLIYQFKLSTLVVGWWKVPGLGSPEMCLYNLVNLLPPIVVCSSPPAQTCKLYFVLFIIIMERKMKYMHYMQSGEGGQLFSKLLRTNGHTTLGPRGPPSPNK